jgi:transcriptional regulator with XRE-family HTH domain
MCNLELMDLHKPKPVGKLLREWRERRRLTQLDLALELEISQHLSFIELGRANPSRELVLRLCEKLDIPLRERNVWLVAAGFAPNFPERALGDPSLAAVCRAIDSMLVGLEPSPAFVIDRHWTLLKTNKAGNYLLKTVDACLLEPPVNMLRLGLHPKGLAPQIINYTEWRKHILKYLSQQIELTADAFLIELLQELRSYPKPSPTKCESSLFAEPEYDRVAVGLRLASNFGELSFLATITVFGTPIDITLSELAVEVFFPANPETARILHKIMPTD